MSRDLFEEYGIEPPKKRKPVDIFEEEGIYYPQESKGFSGIASDAYNKAIEGAMGIPRALMELPGEVYGAGKQFITEPKRALQNIGAGFGELGHGILSAPGNIRDYLVKKGFESQHSYRLPESILPKEYNYAEALGAKGEEPGDVLLRGIPTGVALSPLGELAPGILNITNKIPGISSKSIAKKLSEDKRIVTNAAKEQYKNLFDKASEEGLTHVSIPKIETENIIKQSRQDYHEALTKFLKNPTLENAHWAQSDLGALVRHLTKLDESVGLSSPKQKTLVDAIKAKNDIQRSMFSENKLGRRPDLGEKYAQLSEDYAKNVIPYRQLDELTEFENKKLKAKNMVKSLLKNDEFMLGLGKKYPQLKLNQGLNSVIAKIIGGSALGGAAFKEGQKLFD
jgi:hypothetical protein